MHENNNTKIAKNTLYLYLRLIVTTIIGLYTSRVVLKALGIDDFGLYNVVGGIISMLAALGSTMSIASFRFMSIELGRNDIEELKSVFNSSIIIHFFLAILLLILAETLGLWFIINKIIVPEGRLTSVLWAYQFSILTCIVMIISAPHNNCLLVHEKMNAYALFSMLEAILKLTIVFLLGIGGIDKLIEYSFLIFCIQLLMRGLYGIYCSKNFVETKFSWKYNKSQLTKMLSFTGWSFISILADIGYTEGLNILLNIFFGPAVNAARAITVLVESKVALLGRNIQEAINPQIMKSYGSNNLEYMNQLIINSSRFSFFLLYVIAFPLFVLTDKILIYWLDIVPDYTNIFVKLIIFAVIINALQNPLITATNAVGKIKKYNIILGLTLIGIIPIAYICLKSGAEAYIVFIIQIIFMVITLIIRLYFVSSLLRFPIILYLRQVVFYIILILSISVPVYFLLELLPHENFVSFLIKGIISFLLSITIVYFIGLNNKERVFVKSKIKR